MDAESVFAEVAPPVERLVGGALALPAHAQSLGYCCIQGHDSLVGNDVWGMRLEKDKAIGESIHGAHTHGLLLRVLYPVPASSCGFPSLSRDNEQSPP